MRILALETAGDWCGIAAGDGFLWHVVEERAGQAHSEHALLLVRRVLAEAGWTLGGLDGIAFGAGPGSFTGVRIGCGLAQGLAFGADLPVVPVPTLEALAQEVLRNRGRERVVACIDARMREVYVAAYERTQDSWHEALAPAVLGPAAVVAPSGARWFGAGNGFHVDDSLGKRLGLDGVDAEARATARAVGELALPRLAEGKGVPAQQALPVYVRHRGAWTTAERAAGAIL